MKIVAISDLHGYLPKNLPECDVVVIAGDIVPLDIQRDQIRSISWFLLDFKPWAESLKCDKVIFIAGNHDFMFEQIGTQENCSASDVMKKLLGNYKKSSKLVYLCNGSYKYKGKRFYGFPWCPNLEHWAFYQNHEQLENQCKIIPKKCDVLITHCPPKLGLVGTVLQPCRNYMVDFGCLELANAFDNRDIKWCICGHIHSGLHTAEFINGSNIVNVSLKNEGYEVDYEPFVFEI